MNTRIAIVGLGFGAEFIPIYKKHPDAELVVADFHVDTKPVAADLHPVTTPVRADLHVEAGPAVEEDVRIFNINSRSLAVCKCIG